MIRNSPSNHRRRLLQRAAGGLAGDPGVGRAPPSPRRRQRSSSWPILWRRPNFPPSPLPRWPTRSTSKASGGLEIEFHAGTLLTKELEIINAVKSGNIAIGDPGGAAATVFPEMGVFLVPYLVKSYDQAYKMFNGDDRRSPRQEFQDKYKLKVLCFYDYGFRHFWNSRRPIAAPKDVRGMKLRVQPAQGIRRHDQRSRRRRRADGVGRGDPAAQQGVIDGADLPIVNIVALKAYEVSKYCSMTYHNYGPTRGDQSRHLERPDAGPAEAAARCLAAAQEQVRHLTESVDTVEKAKKLLEPKGMTVNAADVEAFRKIAAGEGLAAVPEGIPRYLGGDRRDQGVTLTAAPSPRTQPSPRSGQDASAAAAETAPAREAGARRNLLLCRKSCVTALLVLAIANMVAGVFLRYVMVADHRFLDLARSIFSGSRRSANISLTWLTMSAPASGIAERAISRCMC